MEHYLHIHGMTCQNCVKDIIGKMNSIEGVSNVKVSLETGKATLRSNHQISLGKLSTILGEKYTISKDKPEFMEYQANSKSKLKGLFPLFLIFGYLILATLFLTYLTGASLKGMMLYFMGLFFIAFSFFKFLDYKGFSISFSRYDPLAKKVFFMQKFTPFWKLF